MYTSGMLVIVTVKTILHMMLLQQNIPKTVLEAFAFTLLVLEKLKLRGIQCQSKPKKSPISEFMILGAMLKEHSDGLNYHV